MKAKLTSIWAFLILGLFSLARAQNVGINTDNSDPDPSAALDVKSTTRGVLIPRMNVSQRQLISSPAQGLLVYQTDGVQGFYFFDGSTWLNLNTGVSDEIADADDDTKIQVEESADEDIIRFDLGGSEQFRMIGRRLEPVTSHTFIGQEAGMNNNFFGSPIGGNVGIGFRALKLNTIGYLNVAIGRQSMENNTTGIGNAAMGYFSLRENSVGINNTALGALALRNTISNDNTGVGHEALTSNITGTENTAVGVSALSSSLGNQNTAIGVDALVSNFAGSENTAIGYAADVGLGDLVNATAIGAHAFVSTSNSLILGQDARVGIGTTSPDASALLELKSSSQGLLLPRMSTPEIVAINNPAEGLVVYNTTKQMPIFYDGTDWRAYDGSNPLYFEIGDYHAGGIVTYVDGTGLHGIVCSITVIDMVASPIVNGLIWGCPNVDVATGNGANGTAVGQGLANTLAIIDAVDNSTCPVDPNLAITFPAAYSIRNYWSSNGYDDWYLPSRGELQLMIQNRTLFNTVSLENGGAGIPSGTYWSSTEHNSTQAYAQSTSGNPALHVKTTDFFAWPIRNF